MDIKRLFRFLNDLEMNNNTQWMAENKKEYLVLKDQFHLFVRGLIEHMSRYDKSVAGVEPKDCIYRINRNLRFSADKRPYKNFFSAYIVQGGRHSHRAGYYIHLQPGGGSMTAGGIYGPTPEMLHVIREEIAYNGEKLVDLIEEKEFHAVYSEITGNKLKTAPKGYPVDHKFIDLLRYKDIGFCHYYVDKEIEKLSEKKLTNEIIEKFKLLVPVSRFFNEALNDLGL